MKIGVDLDDTLMVFQGHWPVLYNEWFDADIDPAGVTGWEDMLTKTHFDTGDDFLAWFDRAGGYDNMPYVRGGPGGVDALLGAGHIVEFITARRGEIALAATRRWHASSPWRDTKLSFRPDKWNIPCSVYIDDSPKTILGLFENRKSIIIFDRPWNWGIDYPVIRGTPGELFRAESWADVLVAVEEMSHV